MASTIKNRKQEEQKMKYYHVEFFMLGDPTAHTRIIVTDKFDQWKKMLENTGALLVIEKELTAQEAMNGQKYYKVLLYV